MLERILILAAVIFFIFLAGKKFNSSKPSFKFKLPDKIKPGNSTLPTIVYFWTDQCVQCKTAQKPALQNLKKEPRRFNLVEVNAVEETELTSSIHIKTVPSTAVFSAAGDLEFLNNGFKNEFEIAEQLEALN